MSNVIVSSSLYNDFKDVLTKRQKLPVQLKFPIGDVGFYKPEKLILNEIDYKNFKNTNDFENYQDKILLIGKNDVLVDIENDLCTYFPIEHYYEFFVPIKLNQELVCNLAKTNINFIFGNCNIPFPECVGYLTKEERATLTLSSKFTLVETVNDVMNVFTYGGTPVSFNHEIKYCTNIINSWFDLIELIKNYKDVAFKNSEYYKTIESFENYTPEYYVNRLFNN